MRRILFTLLFIIVLAIGISCLGQSPSAMQPSRLSSKPHQRTPTLDSWWLPSMPFRKTSTLAPGSLNQWHPPMSILTIPSSVVDSQSPPSTVSVATPTTTTTSTTVPTPVVSVPVFTPSPSDGVTPYEYDAWSKVANCEEGGWDNVAYGPTYVGSLGISAVNWNANARAAGVTDPQTGTIIPGYEASPDQQILVAEQIEGFGYVPDQNGCGGGW